MRVVVKTACFFLVTSAHKTVSPQNKDSRVGSMRPLRAFDVISNLLPRATKTFLGPVYQRRDMDVLHSKLRTEPVILEIQPVHITPILRNLKPH